MMNKLLLFFLLLGSTVCQGQQTNFRYKRTLTNLEYGWNSIPLSNEIFGKVRHDLADIRIIGITANQDTVEAPYVLKHHKDEITTKKLPFEFMNRSFREGTYYFSFKIPVSSAYNELALQFSEENFDWKVTLEGSRDQNEWFTLVENVRIVAIKNAQTDYSFSTLHFPSADYPYLRISVRSTTAPDLLSASITHQKKQEGSYREYGIKKITRQEDKRLKQTVVDLQLFHAVPVSKLELAVRNKQDFYRFLRIQYPSDSFNTPKGWQYVYETVSTGVLSSREKGVYHFDERTTNRLKVIIENEDNTPLDPDSFRVSGYTYELLVKAEAQANYFMVYGDPEANAPVYDLINFSADIPENMKQVSPGPEQHNDISKPAKAEPLFKNKVWLWMIIGLVMAVLSWFSIRMIRNA